MYIIGEKIKEQRRQLGLTQTEFGSVFNVSKQAVHSWESGINMPDINILIRIADYCRIPLCALILGGPHQYCPLSGTVILPVQQKEKQTLTDKDYRLLNKIHALSKERQKAIEILLGIRD